MTRSTATRAAGWLAVAGLLTAAIASPATTLAATVTPIAHPDANITSCPSGYLPIVIAGPTGSDTSGQGTNGGVTVSVTYSAGQTTIAFTVTGGVVNIAYVKGGHGYNEYNYGSAGTTGDTGLVSPLVGNDKNIPVVSHSVFCATAATTTTTTTSAQTTTTAGTTTTTADSTTTTTAGTTTTTADETTSTTADASTTTTADGTTTTTADGTTTTTADASTSTTADGSTTTTTTSSSTSADTTSSETTSSETTSTDTSKASPSGDVKGITGSPQITPPPTDVLAGTSTPTGGNWRMAILAIAGLLSGLLVLTPAAARNRR